MKKFYILIASFVLVIHFDTKAQDVSIPEGGFKDFLMQKYPECFTNLDPDGHLMLNTACTSVTVEDSLEFHNLPNFDPLDLEGIQYFTSLKYLDCSHNSIFSSPVLHRASIEK